MVHTHYAEPDGTQEDENSEDDIIVWKDEPDSPREPVMGEKLTAEQKGDLQKLLDEFVDTMSDIPGKTDLIEHDINAGSARPVRQPPYRLPQAYRAAVKEEIEEMLHSGIIEPSSSEWSSPIVLVNKKDGTMRLGVDYRRLNAVSEADAYPMPRIDDLIDRLGHAKYVTTLDVTKGYWQVPISDQARAKTAFVMPFGLYQFRVMPFGLQGAPATFQRLMDRVLQGLEDFSAAYLDDVVIRSETWEEHLQQLRQVLERIKKAGLTAKLRKCQFGMSECIYLGHIVGSGHVKPATSKLEAIRDFATPRTKKDVRAFLGLTGYYTKFIKDFASTAAPLSDLTRKNGQTKQGLI